MRSRGGFLAAAPLAAALSLAAVGVAGAGSFPNLVIITVDTLRADRLSGSGYERRTSPNIDALMEAGVRFTEARTIEPLTTPAIASLVTALHPHEHGSTRNGLRIRPGLPSFTKILTRRGYTTAAFVGSWTLLDRMSGLAEHFDLYEEVLSRRRWVFFKKEATAEDLTDSALEWLARFVEEEPGRPFLLWVHYVEPHAPYRLHREMLPQLGVSRGGSIFSARNRYDSEVAFADHHIGELLQGMSRLADPAQTLTVFTSDHGESLGEHGYWGHGRHLYEPSLRVPLSLTWPGRVDPGRIDAAVTLLDLPSTIFGVMGFPVPTVFRGRDLSPAVLGEGPPPPAATTFYQAHKGSVQPKEDQSGLRRRGLLEVAVLDGLKKEILRVPLGLRRLFDLSEDPGEKENGVARDSPASAELKAWQREVEEGLRLADSLPPPTLSEEDIEALRALGYVD